VATKLCLNYINRAVIIKTFGGIVMTDKEILAAMKEMLIEEL
jgi:hypothetical protein